MDKTILYLQPSEEVANGVKAGFDNDEDINFICVSSAEETFEMLGRFDVLLLVVDCFIPDMKLNELLTKVAKDYPGVLMNICIDTADLDMLPSIANCDSVVKIFAYPLEKEELEEGIRDSVDAAVNASNVQKHRLLIADEQKQYETSLNNLKGTMYKQHYSYNRLKRVLKPFLEVNAVENADTEFAEFVRDVCEKMLRIMTTAKIDTENIEDIILNEVKSQSSSEYPTSVKNVSSCLRGELERDRLAVIVFILLATIKWQGRCCEQTSVTIDSCYTNSSECRFVVRISGNINDNRNSRIDEYMQKVLQEYCKGYSVTSDGDAYVINLDFEL